MVSQGRERRNDVNTPLTEPATPTGLKSGSSGARPGRRMTDQARKLAFVTPLPTLQQPGCQPGRQHRRQQRGRLGRPCREEGGSRPVGGTPMRTSTTPRTAGDSLALRSAPAASAAHVAGLGIGNSALRGRHPTQTHTDGKRDLTRWRGKRIVMEKKALSLKDDVPWYLPKRQDPNRPTQPSRRFCNPNAIMRCSEPATAATPGHQAMTHKRKA